MLVEQGKTYLLRIINAGVDEIMFFAIAQHNITVVGVDASYIKPLPRDYIVIPPGQTIDALLEANQSPNQYYMAARAYSSGQGVVFDNTTTTAILQYSAHQYTPSSFPSLPYLPFYNDTAASVSFTGALRSLASKDHPAKVPLMVDTQLISTISVNTFPCRSINNSTCQGPNGTRFAASMNNITYRNPSVSILQAYYKDMIKVFGESFPNQPPLIYNFTGDFLPQQLQTPMRGTEVKLLDYNSAMEIVLQGTNLVAGEDHPMHLHGHSFCLVGWGFGNFDKNKDPLRYNLIDPPLQNTGLVPKKGWIAIRFRADNPAFPLSVFVVVVATMLVILVIDFRGLVHALPFGASPYMGNGYCAHNKEWLEISNKCNFTMSEYLWRSLALFCCSVLFYRVVT
ncbi:laccase-14-like [Telopea speciosissima]|uniref:laccase-14-like n=1 Tax=Telopea speciosissima TaxID=54955 RepID=UPI001CC3FA10|nr:laccase-14-like [Telopea speciosissima]